MMTTTRRLLSMSIWSYNIKPMGPVQGFVPATLKCKYQEMSLEVQSIVQSKAQAPMILWFCLASTPTDTALELPIIGKAPNGLAPSQFAYLRSLLARKASSSKAYQ